MICRNCARVAAAGVARSNARTSMQSTAIHRSTAATAPPPPPQLTSVSVPAPPHRFFNTTTTASSSTSSLASVNTSSSTSTTSPSPQPATITSTTAIEKKASPLVKSSVPAGQPLKGLNFLKSAQDPVALPDHEYPAWLWTLLDRQERKTEGGSGGDLFSKSKKQRRIAAKQLRKEQALNPELLEPKIPLYEQTIDLPAATDGSLHSAVHAAQARNDLTKAMRNKRRASIKEANFLKTMG